MKNTMKWLLIAALAPVLGLFAQEATPSPTPLPKTAYEVVLEEMAAVKTMAAATQAENNLAAAIAAGSLSPSEQAQAVIKLYAAYKKLAPHGRALRKWAPKEDRAGDVLRKYAPKDTTLPVSVDLELATTLGDAAQAEIDFAQALPSMSPEEQVNTANQLFAAYKRMSKMKTEGDWVWGVLPKYIPEWATSTAGPVVSYYQHYLSAPVNAKFVKDMNSVKTVDSFNATMSTYLAANVMPERLQALSDNRERTTTLSLATTAAIRVGHSEAVNYALALYCSKPFNKLQINSTVSTVAKALKAKDMNLMRANAFIACQNTGVGAPTITSGERALPTVLAASPVAHLFQPASLETAKAKYRSAATSGAVDAGVYEIAEVLKGMDLNLVRANAWIKSQKDGTPFDLE